jgi:hypothetical protein
MKCNYSDLQEEPVEELGTRGYCDLAAFALRERYPGAPIYRVTDEQGNRFAHVFLFIHGSALDITGRCTIDEMLGRHWEEGFRTEESTPEAVAAFFRKHVREPEEICIVMQRFRDHIRNHPEAFDDNT